MTEYEYIQHRGLTNAELNNFGKEGWELVAVSNWYFYLKRQLRPTRYISQMESLGG